MNRVTKFFCYIANGVLFTLFCIFASVTIGVILMGPLLLSEHLHNPNWLMLYAIHATGFFYTIGSGQIFFKCGGNK